MDTRVAWKNFRLGEELSVSGTFIYNGLRGFYELKKLDFSDELFEVFYNLAVGFERLMKIVVVLLEHNDTIDQKAFEESLITHSHQELLERIKKHASLKLTIPSNDFLSLLTRFYKSLRYNRFSLNSINLHDQEKGELLAFLAKHLNVKFDDPNSIFGVTNDGRYKKFLRRIVSKISEDLYKIVQDRAAELNIYTHELRSGSKAETVFLGKADIPAEDVLWKELLIFFMNTKSTSGYLTFLRGIEPLPFDPALVDDYLDCFQSDSAKSLVRDELEAHYEDITDSARRLQMMAVIGAPGVYFESDDSEEEELLREQ